MKASSDRWYSSTGIAQITGQQLAELIECSRDWLWKGYELRLMKQVSLECLVFLQMTAQSLESGH